MPRPLVVIIIIIIIISIKNEKIRVTLCENAAGALYIVNKMCVDEKCGRVKQVVKTRRRHTVTMFHRTGFQHGFTCKDRHNILLRVPTK